MLKKHLSIYLSIYLLALGCSVHAQDIKKTSELFRIPIEMSQGYLVLRNDSGITQWLIEVKRTSGNSFETIKKVELLKSNYWKIDTDYLNSPNTVLFLTAYDNDNNILASDGPIQICNECQHQALEYKCSKYCVSDDYSYSIDLYTQPNGSGPSKFYFEYQAFAFIDAQNNIAIPFYQFFSPQDFNSIFANINNRKYHDVFQHGVNGQLLDVAPENFPIKVLRLENITANDGLLDINGNALVGTVFAVQKAKGEWVNQYSQTVQLSNGEEQCSTLNFGGFFNMISTYEDPNFPPLNPPLSCSAGNGGGVPDPFDSYSYCSIYDDLSLGQDVLDVLLEATGCNSATPVSFPAPYYFVNISITDLLKGFGFPPVVISGDDVYNEDGSLKKVNFTLDPSLYLCTIVLSSGITVHKILEIQEPLNNQILQKDFLSVNIYPNPIEGNSFNIDFLPLATLKVKYELYDNSGKIHYQSDVYLKKDKAATLKINVDHEIPSGLLINRFTFEDGSYFTVQTIKP